MSGHSKWSKIKHKKAVTDAKKSKSFSKFAQMIAVESKKAEGDAISPALQAVIDRAKQANMPNSNIERAIKKGSSAEADNLEKIIYEAYCPGGVAIIIEGITDNKNRSSAEIKHILSKNSSTLAAQGAASWAFEKTDNGWQAKTPVSISEKEGDSLEKLIAELEENEAVQDIYTNTR